jgi:hypothetical protein
VPPFFCAAAGVAASSATPSVVMDAAFYLSENRMMRTSASQKGFLFSIEPPQFEGNATPVA